VPGGSKAVFLNIKSDYPDLSEYLLSLLSENAVNDGVFSVVDRQQLDLIRAELNFQLSGEVSDESAQSIGQMLGAQSIVSGAVSKLGSLYRVEVKAIEVQSAGVQGQWSRNIPNGATIAALTENYAPSTTAVLVRRAPAATTTAVLQTTVPTVPAWGNGTYTFYPRPRANQGGVDKNTYLDRIVVRGEYFTAFFTGSASGRGGDGDYRPFWDMPRTTLQDLDNPRQPYNPVGQGEDDDVGGTGGWDLTFQGVKPRQFTITGQAVTPPYVFEEITLEQASFVSSGGTSTPAERSGTTGNGGTTALGNGTYTFYPRPRVNQGGVDKNTYLDRIVIRGEYFTAFFTGSASGRGGDGDYKPFWDMPRTTLQDLDNPRQPYNPVSQGEDDDVGGTGGWYLTFQGVKPRRFTITGQAVTPPYVFEEITLGGPD
jgi:hypothetical protein